KLPYTLTFTTELVREVPPREIEIKASGELAGRGLWRLEQKGEMAHITFLWDVRTERPLMRLLSPLLKPLFSWNHDWVMKTGEKALQEEVCRLQLNEMN
ncbi:MAG: polyketide cyclase, partial [Deltaproteobacteria bacterium]|nr:polyketide cyclase [Deltaproteobacteria bacterium]